MELIISIIVLLIAPVALIAIFVVAIIYQLFMMILDDEKRKQRLVDNGLQIAVRFNDGYLLLPAGAVYLVGF